MDKLTLKSNQAGSNSFFRDSVLLPILKYKKITYIVTASSVLMTLLICLLLKNQYTSTATILPSGNTTITSELKDLAAGSLGDLGLGAANQAPDNSSILFPNILSSRLVSERIIERGYSFYFRSRPFNMTLADYIDASNLDRNLEGLKKLVNIDTDRKTGVIKLSVTTKYPELSAAIVHAYLEELDDYNIHHCQTNASENAAFTGQRLNEIKDELAASEDSLKSLKASNMNYMVANDPDLQLELSRLQREVDLKSTLYLTMAQQNEMAKIEAAKDMPVAQILDSGAVPLEKTSPKRSIILLASLIGSLFFSVLLSLWLDVSARRGLNQSIKSIIESPEIQMNRLESRIAGRIVKIADYIGESKIENNKQ
jgi:uncharacterized protein involved in exopolysaccharide biosynthesis